MYNSLTLISNKITALYYFTSVDRLNLYHTYYKSIRDSLNNFGSYENGIKAVLIIFDICAREPLSNRY